jgi:hypothetical protein
LGMHTIAIRTDIHGCAFKGALASMYARIDSQVFSSIYIT